MVINNYNKNLKSWLFFYWKKVWPGSLGLGLISISIVGLELLEPWPLKYLIDSVFGNKPLPAVFASFTTTHQKVILIALSIFVIYGLLSLLHFVKVYFTNWLGLKVDYWISMDYFNKVEHMSLDTFNDNNRSDFVYRQNSEIDAVGSLLLDLPDEFLVSFLTIIGITVVMMKINLTLSLIGFLIIPLLYISIRVFSKRIERQATDVEVSNSKLYGYTNESINNLKLIQAFNKELHRLLGLKKLLRFNIRLKLRYSKTDEGFTLTNDMLATVAMAALIILGSSKVLSGQMTVGDLLIFLTYLADLYTPLQSISEHIGTLKVNLASTKRVFAIFRRNFLVPEKPSPVRVKTVSGHIEFRDVSFAYGSEPVLNHINLNILPGQHVAFIGHSGSGKSSLLNLLPRFSDVQSGQILLDGVDVRDMSLEDLRQQFSIVSQETAIFSTSVYNNLAFAKPNGRPTKEEIARAVKAANAVEIIEDLPDKYETLLTDSGSNLSGGQRQRLSIARAFLKNAPILLLDEPTSALDNESEQIVSRALHSLMQNKTALVISHDGGMLNDVDLIYVVEKGQIVDFIDRRESKSTFSNLIEAVQQST